MVSQSPGARALQKAATRARVLVAAREALEARGYDGTNLRDVAAAAGVSAGTVLLHFRDKRDLLHAALFDDLESTWAAARKPRRKGEKASSLVAELTALAGAFFAYYEARPTLSRTLLRESLFAESPWKERFTGQVGEVSAHIAGLLQRAQERGEIPASVDPPLFIATYFSFYYFALLAWVQGGHPAPRRLFERMLGEHVRGLS